MGGDMHIVRCHDPNAKRFMALTSVLHDETLSAKAKGIYCVLVANGLTELSQISKCYKHFSECRESVNGGLRELVDHGVIKANPKPSQDRREPKYLQWRETVLKRDGRCMTCGSGETLHAHHIMPWLEFPALRYEVPNGITLCSACHAKIHSSLRGLF